MRYYLIRGESAWTGDGSEDNPYRLLLPPDAGQIILAPAVPDPRPWPVLAAYSEPLATVPVFYRELGDVLDTALPSRVKRLLESSLGLTLAEASPRRVIAELLLLHGREDGSRWRRLNANRAGRYEVWLGEKIWDEPAPTATVLTETFPTNGSFTSGQDQTWTIVAGTFSVVGGEARTDGTATRHVAVANAPLATADHITEADVRQDTTYAYTSGVLVRALTTTQTNYHGGLDANAAVAKIERTVNGSNTQLATTPYTVGTGVYRVKVSADGSTIQLVVDGTTAVTVTDTAISGGVRGGIRSFPTSTGRVYWDNWTAYDLVTAPTPIDTATSTGTATSATSVDAAIDSSMTTDVATATATATAAIESGTITGAATSAIAVEKTNAVASATTTTPATATPAVAAALDTATVAVVATGVSGADASLDTTTVTGTATSKPTVAATVPISTQTTTNATVSTFTSMADAATATTAEPAVSGVATDVTTGTSTTTGLGASAPTVAANVPIATQTTTSAATSTLGVSAGVETATTADPAITAHSLSVTTDSATLSGLATSTFDATSDTPVSSATVPGQATSSSVVSVTVATNTEASLADNALAVDAATMAATLAASVAISWDTLALTAVDTMGSLATSIVLVETIESITSTTITATSTSSFSVVIVETPTARRTFLAPHTVPPFIATDTITGTLVATRSPRTFEAKGPS